MINIGPYAKAVTSGLGNAIAFGTEAAALLELVPADQQWAARSVVVVLGVLHVANTFHVWLVKNEPVIEAAVAAGEELVEDVEDVVGRHAAKPPAVTIEPAVPENARVTITDALPGFVPGPFAQQIVDTADALTEAASHVPAVASAISDGEKAAADAIRNLRL
jgi:hypothetical protein